MERKRTRIREHKKQVIKELMTLYSKLNWSVEDKERTNTLRSKLDEMCICSLIIDGVECIEPKIISKEVFNFYRNLYKFSYSEQSASSFFDKINNLIPIIDGNLKEICDEKLRIIEFDCTIEKMASDRSPEPDGIAANFYKHF